MGRTDIPVACAVVVATMVTTAWMRGVVGYLEPTKLGAYF